MSTVNRTEASPSEMATFFSQIDPDNDPRGAIARVQERVREFQQAGRPIPEDLERFQRNLITELVSESQGR